MFNVTVNISYLYKDIVMTIKSTPNLTSTQLTKCYHICYLM